MIAVDANKARVRVARDQWFHRFDTLQFEFQFVDFVFEHGQFAALLVDFFPFDFILR